MSVKVPSKLLEMRRGGRVIDGRAWACLQRCQRELSLDTIPTPVPVEEWIESPLDIRFGYEDLSHLGEGVLGAAFIQEREILIDSKVTDHDGRCRFTCAHELGHMVLHRSAHDRFLENSLDVGVVTDKLERQAHRFAASFLMPLPNLERVIVEALHARGLKRAECLYELMQPTIESEWLWRYHVLPAITREFDVSLSAAIYRCMDVQPTIRHPQPLFPRELHPHLMRRAGKNDDVAYVQVSDGVPAYRHLFADVDVK